MIGFNIPGKVLEGPNGKPLVKAKVVFNGKIAAVTNEDGSFVLEKIKAGSHKIYVEAGKRRCCIFNNNEFINMLIDMIVSALCTIKQRSLHLSILRVLSNAAFVGSFSCQLPGQIRVVQSFCV